MDKYIYFLFKKQKFAIVLFAGRTAYPLDGPGVVALQYIHIQDWRVEFRRADVGDRHAGLALPSVYII